MKLVTKAEWGASPKTATKATHPIGATLGVTFHWEGPHMGDFPHSKCAFKVRVIERYHELTRGWADIAYNALVCPHGYVFEGRGPGVKSAANGTDLGNDTHYAVCYLGGVGDGFTDEGKQGMEDAREWLRDEGDAGKAVNGHRDHKSTQCPGDEIYDWLHTHRWDEEFTAATANIKSGMSIPKVLADVRKVLAADPDLIGFQEIGGTIRATAMRALLRRRGYRLLRPGRTPSPLAFKRSRFDLDQRLRVKLSDATRVGPEGAGPPVLREKHATVAVLLDMLADEQVVAIVGHLAPSIHLQIRAKLHEAQVDELARIGRAYKRARLVYMFDGNTTDRAKLQPITNLGVKWGRPIATHGKRSIDYVGATHAQPAGAKAIELNSDHRALVRRFRHSKEK